MLVAGLLLAGFAAGEDGVFAWAADRLARAEVAPLALYGLALVAIAVVTAVLNLDTAVVFLTPLLVALARTRGIAEEPFLYASLLMANASSLFLPGSNLTNLIVLASEDVPGGVYAARTVGAAAVAALVTALALVVIYRRRLVGVAGRRSQLAADARPGALGLAAVAAVAVLTVALRDPALPVFGVGVVAAVAVAARRGLSLRRVVDAASPLVTAGLFVAAVALGTLARHWDGPARLLAHAGRWGSAGIGALAAITVNNLPASVLLSAQPPQHARALLIGLNIGPNIVATGSLSAYLWWRAARAADARPSLLELTRRGAPIALLAGTAALASLWLT